MVRDKRVSDGSIPTKKEIDTSNVTERTTLPCECQQAGYIENWRDIRGYEGYYQVSNTGKVRSVKKRKGRVGVLNPVNNGRGYYAVMLYMPNKKETRFYVHRLVGSAFIPNPFGYLEINHKDFERNHNCVHNLEWVDRQGNMKYSGRAGRAKPPTKRGESNYKAKLTANEVVEIRLSNLSVNKLAVKYSVTPTMIRYIVKRMNWKHI